MSSLKNFGAPCNILINNLKDHLHSPVVIWGPVDSMNKLQSNESICSLLIMCLVLYPG